MRVLIAFRAVMSATHAVILWALRAGRYQLSAGKYIVGAAILLIAGLVVLVWRRHQLEDGRPGRADGSSSASAEELDLESADLRVIPWVGDEPGRLAGLWAPDGEAQRLEPGVYGGDRRPLVGDGTQRK